MNMYNSITRTEALEKLKELQGCHDEETEHFEADDILCRLLVSLGYEDVVEEYEKVGKWYA